MSCGELKVIEWKKPIRKGFPLSGRLTFSRRGEIFVLADHNLLFAIKPFSSTNGAKVSPIFIFDDNTAIFTFPAATTVNMSVGIWVGFLGASRISDGDLSHAANFRIPVVEVLIP